MLYAIKVARLTQNTDNVDVVIFPPFPFIYPVNNVLKNAKVKVGAQDCYYESEGAFTGEVATSMVYDVGASYVLCGHSERRTIFNDDDKTINFKVRNFYYRSYFYDDQNL